LRMTLEGMLYKLRVRCPWRDLPTELGPWNSVFKRFHEWTKKGSFLAIFKELSDDSDHE
jgi:transposase